MRTTVGDNIAAARKTQSLTQRELAAAVGTEGFAISRWERGIVAPGPAYLAALAFVLNHDIAWFYTDHETDRAAA